jgi:DDE domain
VVLALFPFVPRRRGVARRTGLARRSRHRLEVGPALRPEMERRLRSRLKPTNDSWRVDETYIRIKGKWVYLYRAVDSTGATVDFLLSAKRDTVAAKRLLAKALGRREPSPPSGHQHRQGRRLSASHRTTPTTQSRGRSGGELWTSTGAISQQCTGTGIIGRSSDGSARVSIFAGELGAQFALLLSQYRYFTEHRL